MTGYQDDSAWYRQIEFEIENLKLTLDKKQAGKFQLDLLKRIAARADEYSQTCSECESMKSQITELLREVPLLVQTPSKEAVKRYRQSVSGMTAHLKKSHGLVDAGTYMGVGIAIGAGLGAALGAALANYAFSGIGVALGVAIGSALDAKAKKDGKVL